MKMWELASGIQVPMTLEEADLLDKFLKEESPSLTEREKVVAQSMTQKEILISEEKEDEHFYKMNYHVEVWRD